LKKIQAGLRLATEQSSSLVSSVNRPARICGQILAAKQEQADFARRKRTASSVNHFNIKQTSKKSSFLR
jgi:hypothetical protein